MAASPRKLSAKEVQALVGGLMDMDGDTTRVGENGQEVRSYTFGSNDLSLLGDYYALRMINERFCRIARSVFLPMLRFQPRISAFPPEIRSFDDYRNSQDNFVSLTISRIEELRGSQLLVMAPGFISLLTDAYYGGSIRPIRQTRNEFTATEHRVIEIISNQLNQSLQLAWRDLMRLSFNPTSREENMQFVAFVENEDMVVNCSFMVQLPDQEPATFDILYPLQTLRPISSQLRSRMQSDSVDDDRTWRDRLERAILSIPLQITARLAEPELPLRMLLSLQEGDVIPVNLSESVDVLIEGHHLFTATPGNQAGQSALSILHKTIG